MYKELTLIYLENGRVYNENRVCNFENENLATKIYFSVPEGYELFTFVLDLKNGDVTSQVELGIGSPSYSYILDDSLTLTGTLELQLWATILSGNETVKVQWEKYNLTINDALNISIITAEANPDIIATHTSQIADLYNITSILDTTGDGSLFLSDDGTYQSPGSIGTRDYSSITNKPQINSIELVGNKTSSDLGLQPAGSYEPANSNIQSHIADSNIHFTSTEKTNVGKLISTGDGSKYLGDDGNYTTVSSGTMDYDDLSNKPSINSVELTGNKTSAELRLGEEIYYRIRADVDLNKGDLLQINSIGSDYIGVTKCNRYLIGIYPQYMMGLATSDLSSGEYGKAIYHGRIDGVDTSTFAVTSYLYPGDPDGALSTTPYITAVSEKVIVGVVLESAVSGSISIRPETYPKLGSIADFEIAGVIHDGDLINFNEATQRWTNSYNINDYLADVDVSSISNNDILRWNSSTSKWKNYTSDIYKTFAGFVNRTDSTISVNASGVVTLAPAVTSFTVYTMGTKHVLTNTQTVTVTSDQTITYIYLDSAGVLQKSITSWDLTSGLNIPVAICFKDGSTYALTDERHGHERNKAWHYWAHNNIGAMYKSGLTGTFATSTLSVTQGIISDEDIPADTGSTRTTCSLWYRNATTGMRFVRGSTYAKAVSGGGVLQYDNGSGTLQDVSNNNYVTNWVYATNDPTEPIYCVIGQNNSPSLTVARNTPAPTINLSTAEWKLIYRVIYNRTTGVPAGNFIEAADFRTVQTGVATSSTITDHNSLINRDATNSHPASAISYDNGGDVLTNVQTELDGRLNKSYVISIATGDWSTNTYTQTITGLTDADFVDIWATTDTDEGYIDSWGITWTQSGNTITFTKTGSATTTLSLNMAIIKCTDGGTL